MHSVRNGDLNGSEMGIHFSREQGDDLTYLRPRGVEDRVWSLT
jgi:hypothetical protein